MSRNLGGSELRVFSFRNKDYLRICSADHPGMVTKFRIAKALARALAIPSEGPHGARGALKAGAIACICEVAF
jgi:hypothetical protein